ncbi:MAG TPA: glycosyltransferase [Vicinamibacterales bacterium]
MRALAIIPIFNDWTSVAELVTRLDEVARTSALSLQILLVDDGSTTDDGGRLAALRLTAVRALDILRLRRNLGHQRAIAIGLAYVEQHVEHQAVVIMDGDGEDRPEDVPRLLAAMTVEGEEGESIVFAERLRRSEGLRFASLYWLYRTIHRLLTGEQVRVGNFSAIPASLLPRLVAVSQLWNHFAAAVFDSRFRRRTVPTTRGRRYSGSSHLNYVDLTTHGLSAMSVFAARIGVRLLVVTVVLAGVATIAIGAALAWLYIHGGPVPAWMAYLIGTLIVLIVQAAAVSLMFVFTILGGREGAAFLPLRDYAYYVARLDHVLPRP